MSERVIAVNTKILDSKGIERAGLEVVFDGSRVTYRTLDGIEYQSQQLLGADFLVSPTQAAIIMKGFGG